MDDKLTVAVLTNLADDEPDVIAKKVAEVYISGHVN